MRSKTERFTQGATWRTFAVARAGLALLAGVMLVSGCASTASKMASPYEIALIADKDVNPDAHGRPSPVQITVYEMKTSRTFEESDFFTLHGDARKALGEELIQAEQVILRPGESHTIRREGDVNARVVGIVAAFRDLERSQWRLVAPLPVPQNTNIYKIWQFSPNPETIHIGVGRQDIRVTDRERSWWPF